MVCMYALAVVLLGVFSAVEGAITPPNFAMAK